MLTMFHLDSAGFQTVRSLIFIWAAVLEQSWTYKGKTEKESNETWPMS